MVLLPYPEAFRQLLQLYLDRRLPLPGTSRVELLDCSTQASKLGSVSSIFVDDLESLTRVPIAPDLAIVGAFGCCNGGMVFGEAVRIRVGHDDW